MNGVCAVCALNASVSLPTPLPARPSLSSLRFPPGATAPLPGSGHSGSEGARLGLPTPPVPGPAIPSAATVPGSVTGLGPQPDRSQAVRGNLATLSEPWGWGGGRGRGRKRLLPADPTPGLQGSGWAGRGCGMGREGAAENEADTWGSGTDGRRNRNDRCFYPSPGFSHA